MRLRIWLAAAIVIAIAGVFFTWRALSRYDAAAMLACLPPDDATHLYLDVSALRQGGILALLAGSKTDEEPDYKKFVDQTGFDYQRDLDAVAAAFLNGGAYYTIRGRFDWSKLAAYAKSQQGDCVKNLCWMPASDGKRHISFYRLSSGVLALAVAAEERAVNMIAPRQWKSAPKLPPDPIWISAPSFAFSDPKELPAGAQAFLRPLSQAERVVFAVGPSGPRWQIRLDASCATPDSAAAVAQKLTATTDLLKKMLEREKMTPNPRDLSGVLVAGTFQQQDRRVTGSWPVERGFLETLASGKLQ